MLLPRPPKSLGLQAALQLPPQPPHSSLKPALPYSGALGLPRGPPPTTHLENAGLRAAKPTLPGRPPQRTPRRQLISCPPGYDSSPQGSGEGVCLGGTRGRGCSPSSLGHTEPWVQLQTLRLKGVKSLHSSGRAEVVRDPGSQPKARILTEEAPPVGPEWVPRTRTGQPRTPDSSAQRPRALPAGRTPALRRSFPSSRLPAAPLLQPQFLHLATRESLQAGQARTVLWNAAHAGVPAAWARAVLSRGLTAPTRQGLGTRNAQAQAPRPSHCHREVGDDSGLESAASEEGEADQALPAGPAGPLAGTEPGSSALRDWSPEPPPRENSHAHAHTCTQRRPAIRVGAAELTSPGNRNQGWWFAVGMEAVSRPEGLTQALECPVPPKQKLRPGQGHRAAG
ncbi:hypothetical protein AAY473_027532 [Plecturocebus cupreus]